MSRCPTHEAEINYDRATTLTFWQEQERFRAEKAHWLDIVGSLIRGEAVIDGGITYTLAERMANEYVDFAEMVNEDIDFMEKFKNGEFSKEVMALFVEQARTLASVIVGK